MAAAEPSREQVLSEIHDQVAVFVKQLDELMKGLTPEQASSLVDPAKHLLTVATFLRDATIDLLEAGGIPADDDTPGREPIDA